MMRWPTSWHTVLRMGGGLCLLGCAASLCAQDYLFAYFQEPGNQGIYLALSHDGYHFEPLNDGQPWLKPEKPGELMRDVFLTRGPDGKFQMVWTWNWRGKTMGHAESHDLLHWGEQQEIPIMADFAEVRNVWAPETDWDAVHRKWMVIWSSAKTDVADSNRIWSSETADWQHFSQPKVFFDPGYEVIDATMFHGKDKQYLVFKEQTKEPLTYQVRVASGPTLQGPWTVITGPITESWSEGPSVIQVGDEHVVYYDHYRPPRARYEGVQSNDWVHWESVDDRISFPQGCKHGSFLEITPEEAARLESRHDPAPATAPPSTTP